MADEADDAEAMQDAVSFLDESTEVEAPQVGGVEDGVVWTGGSNLGPNEDEADGTLCCRPTKPFAQKSKHHDLLKKGVDKDMRLDIDVGTDAKQVITVIGWVMAIESLILINGCDTVFRMCDMDEDGTLSNEVFICQIWGKIKMESLEKWIKALNEVIGDSHDRLNLKLSGISLREPHWDRICCRE